ncbi:DNA fragmentation factor subunit beta [Ceratina calcarata]|uniref:DNAation factor subunit beta n=1 Tax=Ceratina calcarata TaxID=156304 RepID=A0AAJ7J424_9HYME|nr:DNA fragmentation factor subunit beta [Ceratina calcarata]
MSLIVNCFRRLADAPAKNELKGYKVTDVNRTRKVGVACRSLQELKRKACAKLNVTNDLAEINVYLVDGSLIDEEEYFSTLKPQTTLILQKPGEKVLSDADLLYDTLRRVNIDFLAAGEKASEFLTENLKAKVAVLNNTLNKDDTKTRLSSRDEHPEWFRGLETNCATKEAYLHRRCQDRIRGYLYKTIEQIKSSDIFSKDPRARKQLLYAIAFFKMQLKEDHYFGYYFDRSRAENEDAKASDELDSSSCYDHCPCRLKWFEYSAYFRLFGTPEQSCDGVDGIRKKNERNTMMDSKTEEEEAEDTCPYKIRKTEKETRHAICDPMGEFRCAGIWNEEKCSYGDQHRINPYRSREELILFSTWNFDHKIERSRSLVPLLLKLAAQGNTNETDLFEIYDNLFTTKNLRLVHIVCHDKTSHK